MRAPTSPALSVTKGPGDLLGPFVILNPACRVHDGDLAEAILDRLHERGVHFSLRGRSYRTRHLTEEEPSTRRAKSA